MMFSLISIIVPVYQSVNSIRRCIDSIVNQTYHNIQIIIVDDGSTDGSSEICDQYMQEYDFIEVIHINNQGPVIARKEGLKRAQGDYIGFVDSDDYIEPEMFEKLYLEIIESGADFVHSWFLSIFNNKQEYELKPYSDATTIDNDSNRELAIIKYFFNDKTRLSSSMWSKLYKKEFAIANYALIPETVKYGEDTLFLFACIANCKKISIIDGCYYNYIVRDDSLSHVTIKRRFYKEIRLMSLLGELNEKLGFPLNEEYLLEWVRNKTYSLLSRTAKKSMSDLLKNNQYYIRDIEKYRNKRIAIYGAGMIGRDYLQQMDLLDFDIPVAVFDKNERKILWGRINVINPVEILNYDFDYLIIAILNEETVDEIKKNLISMGVKEKKIIWEKPYR